MCHIMWHIVKSLCDATHLRKRGPGFMILLFGCSCWIEPQILRLDRANNRAGSLGMTGE